MQPLKPARHKLRIIIPIFILAILAIFGLGIYLLPSFIDQTYTNPRDGSKIVLRKDASYAVQVPGFETLYGKVEKLNSDYLSMTSVANKQRGYEGLLGWNEPWQAAPTLFIRSAMISSLRKLDDSKPDENNVITSIAVTIPDNSKPLRGWPVESNLNSKQWQAFFFDDGNMLFAKASSVKGNFLNGHVYGISTQGTVTLALKKPSEYQNLTSDKLVFWQNLPEAGKIAKAIAATEMK